MSKTNQSTTTHSAAAEITPESTTARTVLYSFPQQGIGDWKTQDDVVMGGVSDSKLTLTEDGRARFTGRVSLENNGGFCSMRRSSQDDPYHVSDKSSFALRLRGDGKDYNFRVRTPNGRHAYAFTFPTKAGDDWETINIPFSAMQATYRGESVDVPNYNGEDILEMQLLIGNKKEESFEIVIDAIEVI